MILRTAYVRLGKPWPEEAARHGSRNMVHIESDERNNLHIWWLAHEKEED
jgi:hypothetical protein